MQARTANGARPRANRVSPTGGRGRRVGPADGLGLTRPFAASWALGRFGWVGAEAHPADPGRIVGGLPLHAGLACIRVL